MPYTTAAVPENTRPVLTCIVRFRRQESLSFGTRQPNTNQEAGKLDWTEFAPLVPCGYLDHNDNLVLAENYLEYGPFSQGLAAVRDPVSWRLGYLRPNQSWLIEPMLDAGGTFSEGLGGTATAAPRRQPYG